MDPINSEQNIRYPLQTFALNLVGQQLSLSHLRIHERELVSNQNVRVVILVMANIWHDVAVIRYLSIYLSIYLLLHHFLYINICGCLSYSFCCKISQMQLSSCIHVCMYLFMSVLISRSISLFMSKYIFVFSASDCMVSVIPPLTHSLTHSYIYKVYLDNNISLGHLWTIIISSNTTNISKFHSFISIYWPTYLLTHIYEYMYKIAWLIEWFYGVLLG